MSVESLQKLAVAVERLSASLDGSDVNAIDRAVADMRPILADLDTQQGWARQPEAAGIAINMAGVLEAARIRINILNDMARQQLDLLATRGVVAGTTTYGR